ncbi:hypothetical protein [Saccharopolyspora spinosa]|uniref:Uncharacterized protein n=1 Tax=Saccharopolyspora spinosa TaxID=60894 RepID=A0A2N3YAE3_SACSN|nr:hypothetical protein [Saccharopolyspora spinosa]PKW19843.1 hypothetical protein A8926_8041 [Saccharopolyspora spinosa]
MSARLELLIAAAVAAREKLRRDQFIANGKGMAFHIFQYVPTKWTAHGRYYWRW